MHIMVVIRFSPLVLLAMLAVMPSSGQAQGQDEPRLIEEIIVTATKRSTSIQDVPFSVSVLRSEQIGRSGIQSIEQLSRNFAGVSVQNLGPGQSQVAMRGVSAGQIIRDQPGVKEQVGIYMDESPVSLSLFTPDFDLFDLDRVEVLRGPQGTLFGAGSVGGTIRYITNQPEIGRDYGIVEADLNTLADGGNGGHVKGMTNVGLADSAAIRLVAFATEHAGFIDALSEGGARHDDVNHGTRRGLRASLLLSPVDSLRITPRVVYQEVDYDGFNREEVYNLFANPYTTSRPAIKLKEREQYLLLEEGFEDETLLFDVTLDTDFGPFSLHSVTSYLTREVLVSRDASALGASVGISPLGVPDEGVRFAFNLRDTTDLAQLVQELRVASTGDAGWQWLFGVFYSELERDYAQRLPTPGYDAYIDAHRGGPVSSSSYNGYRLSDSPYNSDLPYDITQFAVFGEASTDLGERLTVTLGGRWYDWAEERTFHSGGLFSNGDLQTDDTDSNGFSPRVMASYAVRDGLTLNAQAARGFRLGGVNDPLNAGLCTPGDLATFGRFQAYDDESIWNYEVGIKGDFASGLRLNLAAFHATIEDLQVTLDAGSCSSRISFNVSDAHTTGLEFELSGEPVPGLEVSLAGSLVEAQFDDTVVSDAGGILGGVEKGNRFASVPEFQLATTASYEFRVDWFGGADAYVFASWQYVGDRITQPSDQVAGAGRFVSMLPYAGATGEEVTDIDLELDAFSLVGLRFGVIKGDWEGAVYIHNLTDENAALSFDRERGGRARLGFRVNQPRTIGLLIRKSFG